MASPMTGKERIRIALNQGMPDMVPTWDWLDEPVTLGVAEYLGLKSHGEITTIWCFFAVCLLRNIAFDVILRRRRHLTPGN